MSRVVLRACLLALAWPALASCATQDERQDRPVPPGCTAEPARARVVEPLAREVVRMPGEPFDIVVGPAARWAVVSLPSTRGPRRLAVLRLGAGRRARVVHTVELGRGLQPFGLDLAGAHLFVAAGAGLLAIDVEPLVLRGRLVTERLAGGAGLIQVDASRDGRRIFASDESRPEQLAVTRGPSGAPGRVERIAIPPAPVGVALSQDERRLYATSQYGDGLEPGGVLSVFDAAAALDGDPEALLARVPAVAGSCGTLLVAGSDRFTPAGRGGWLSTVDRSPRGYDIASVRAGRFPRELPPADDGRVHLTAFASGAVHALRLRALPSCGPA